MPRTVIHDECLQFKAKKYVEHWNWSIFYVSTSSRTLTRTDARNEFWIEVGAISRVCVYLLHLLFKPRLNMLHSVVKLQMCRQNSSLPETKRLEILRKMLKQGPSHAKAEKGKVQASPLQGQALHGAFNDEAFRGAIRIRI